MSHIRCRDGLIDLSVGTGVWFTFSALGKWGLARSFLSVCIPSYGVWWEPHCCFALKIVMFRFTHLQTVSSKREPKFAVGIAPSGLHCAFPPDFVLKVQDSNGKKEKAKFK